MLEEFAERVSKVLEDYDSLPEKDYECKKCPIIFIKKVRKADSCADLVKQMDPELSAKRYLPCKKIVSTVKDYYYNIYYNSLFNGVC